MLTHSWPKQTVPPPASRLQSSWLFLSLPYSLPIRGRMVILERMSCVELLLYCERTSIRHAQNAQDDPKTLTYIRDTSRQRRSNFATIQSHSRSTPIARWTHNTHCTYSHARDIQPSRMLGGSERSLQPRRALSGRHSILRHDRADLDT